MMPPVTAPAPPPARAAASGPATIMPRPGTVMVVPMARTAARVAPTAVPMAPPAATPSAALVSAVMGRSPSWGK